jgi:REP element-mobilizing transposase RayT
VRELIANKRRFSSPPRREEAVHGFRGWHERGYLPHRDQPGLVQFVTFRLADSYPAALRAEWEHLLQIEDDRQRRTRIEAYLDKGRGECWLRRTGIACLMEESLFLFHGRRYELRAWVIMPNHVHVLVKAVANSLSTIVGNWKKHTARLANRLLGLNGTFWAADYWDTFMRDSSHEETTVRYIESNPCKAGLVLDPRSWRWSSARWRDQYNRLELAVAAEGHQGRPQRPRAARLQS